jgi:hypothetical protein
MSIISAIEHDRGVAYARDCVYNNLTESPPATPEIAPEPGDPAAAERALGESQLQWGSLTEAGDLLLLLDLMQTEEELVLGAVTNDSRRIPRIELELLLRGVELLLVAAAADDVDLGRAGDITGVEPMIHGPGWLRVDSCWIELPEVQRLVDDALRVPAARVFAVPDAQGKPALVAYLAASAGIQTPRQAHAACMALLPRHGRPQPPGGRRYTAMAPGRYVICGRAPEDPSDLAAWQRQPVLAHGDGRLGKDP